MLMCEISQCFILSCSQQGDFRQMCVCGCVRACMHACMCERERERVFNIFQLVLQTSCVCCALQVGQHLACLERRPTSLDVTVLWCLATSCRWQHSTLLSSTFPWTLPLDSHLVPHTLLPGLDSVVCVYVPAYV